MNHVSAVPPHRPRGSGDGWVELPDGRRFWGRAGAAGVLAFTPEGAVLLQHRVAWSHFGGTWGLPGGARDLRESALDAALREAREETGIDTAALEPRLAVLLDLGVWSYTTVLAGAGTELSVSVSDSESTELAWVTGSEVEQRQLHPGFGAAWPRLRALIGPREALVVDAANVVGSRPDGWWHDRAGAAERLLAALTTLARVGLAEEPAEGELPVVRRWPEIVAVLEGEARAAATDGAATEGAVTVVLAEHDGDTAVVAAVQRRAAEGRPATVVTADRGLAQRVRVAGGTVMSPSRLLRMLP